MKNNIPDIYEMGLFKKLVKWFFEILILPFQILMFIIFMFIVGIYIYAMLTDPKSLGIKSKEEIRNDIIRDELDPFAVNSKKK